MFKGHWYKVHKYREDGTLDYEGTLDSNGEAHGRGTLYHEDGTTIKYSGDWAHGKSHGSGTAYDEQGRKHYEGEWAHGLSRGEGTAYADGVVVYKGHFANGLWHGRGATDEQEGYWDRGVYVGENAVHMICGNSCTVEQISDMVHATATNGEWDYRGAVNEEMQPHGRGRLETAEGVYKGHFKDGKRHGAGIMRYEFGLTVHGQWHEDKEVDGKMHITAEGVTVACERSAAAPAAPATEAPAAPADVVTRFIKGARVRRGPDWKWDNQDRYGTGVMIERGMTSGWVKVQWAHGGTNNYRIRGKYDLVFVDKAYKRSGYSECIKGFSTDKRRVRDPVTGQYVLARDTMDKWYLARVTKVERSRVYVHYEGWSSTWDEWLDMDDRRLANFGFRDLTSKVIENAKDMDHIRYPAVGDPLGLDRYWCPQ